METNNIDTAMVYRTVADLLPTEGRDFNLGIARGKDGSQTLVIEAVTKLGEAWVPFLRERLEGPLKDANVSVDDAHAGEASGGAVATVTTETKAAEEETASRLEARIRDQEKAAEKAMEAAKAARSARVEKSGEDSPQSREETDAARAVQAAERELRVAKSVAGKVASIRNAVNVRARQAASEDAKRGKDWSVDMNAPLLTLFDRSDVANKLRHKEDLIVQMAQHSAAMDDLGAAAVNMAKQYILPKESK